MVRLHEEERAEKPPIRILSLLKCPSSEYQTSKKEERYADEGSCMGDVLL